MSTGNAATVRDDDLFDISGRAAIVTGASSGIGRHFAAVLAARGARVALAARREDRLRALEAEIRAAGGEAVPVAMDVTDAASVRAGFDAAAAAVGIPTIVINNSGVATTKPALEVEESDWDAILDTNLKGAWLVAREAARRLAAADLAGSIVNIASVLAFRVTGALSPYSASKAGLVHLTHALALELARHRVRVNAIAPGYIVTEMNREFLESPPGARIVDRIPQRRPGQPEDLDGALLLLASDASRFMTGSTIVVDGGHLVTSI